MHEIYINNYDVCEHSGCEHCLTHEVMTVLNLFISKILKEISFLEEDIVKHLYTGLFV
jgi:hypothetical protein